MQVEFEAICGPKFTTFQDDVGDPLQLSTHLTDCLFHVSFRRYAPLNLPLSCEVVRKWWFLGPRFVGGGIPQILDMRYEIAVIFEYVVDFHRVPFSELGDQAAKKIKKKNPW